MKSFSSIIKMEYYLEKSTMKDLMVRFITESKTHFRLTNTSILFRWMAYWNMQKQIVRSIMSPYNYLEPSKVNKKALLSKQRLFFIGK